MPEELDPTTARLVSELAALILPSLTKSLNAAIPSGDFTGAIERTNRMTQDMRSGIEKAIRSGIDDSRAGRSMIIQSIGSVLEEVSSLRKMLGKVPEMLEESIRNSRPEEPKNDDDNASFREEVMNELEEFSGRIDTLTQGIKAFFETYAEDREQSSTLPEDLVRSSVDADALSGLEGLVRAEGKSRSRELEELSREISAMHEQGNIALVHEVREAVSEEVAGIIPGDEGFSGGTLRGSSSMKMLKVIAGLSGGCLVLLVLNFLILLFR